MVAIFILDRFDPWARAAMPGAALKASPPARIFTNFLRLVGKEKSFVITHSAAGSKDKARQDGTGWSISRGANRRYDGRGSGTQPRGRPDRRFSLLSSQTFGVSGREKCR